MGYSPYATERLNRNRPFDRKESMNVRFPPKHTNDYTGCPPSFESTVTTFLPLVQRLATNYLKACALVLHLPTDYFASAMANMDLCTVRVLHAPPCLYNASIALDQAVRVGEHMDFGACTFLWYDDSSEGLQIKPVDGGQIGGSAGGEEGGWLDINVTTPNKNGGSVLVNTGALMARWTNDVWRATAHRVIVPNEKAAQKDRYCLACFIDPDAETIVKVHEKFCSPENPKSMSLYRLWTISWES